MLPVMVLAAGLGTRLRPLTEHCAKPLVPVGDRPALAHVLDRLRAAGATRIVVNAHHHAGQVRAFVEGLGPGAGVSLSEETDLLGLVDALIDVELELGLGPVQSVDERLGVGLPCFLGERHGIVRVRHRRRRSDDHRSGWFWSDRDWLRDDYGDHYDRI